MLHSKVLEMFKRLDVNGEGRISFDDMARLFELLEADINTDQFLQALDQDDNGQVDYATFLKWVMGDASPAELVWALMSDE
jgi:Ca2+-binding EF-hand superfamily protein